MRFNDLSLSQRVKRCREFTAPYRIADGRKFKLKDIDPGDTGDLEAEDKPRGEGGAADRGSRRWPSCRTSSTRRTDGPCC